MTVKNTSSKTGANIAELFDDVVNEVTDRFQGPPSSRPPPLTKPAGAPRLACRHRLTLGLRWAQRTGRVTSRLNP